MNPVNAPTRPTATADEAVATVEAPVKDTLTEDETVETASARVAAPATKRPPAKRPPAKPKVTCEDCFFFQNDLCALEKKQPCPAFRPAGEGLKAPKQLSLVFRQERARSAWVFQQPR